MKMMMKLESRRCVSRLLTCSYSWATQNSCYW